MVSASLIGVGLIAAAAAAITTVSVSTAVITAVTTAGVSTAISAVDGAVCARMSGGDWKNGAMAGAIGGSVGTLVSKLTGPTPLPDTTLRLNTAGRVASSVAYDITYDLFERDTIDASTAVVTGIDTAMDATISTICYYYTGGIINSYAQAGVNGVLDGVVDIFQTRFYFTPW